jgi:hypothetical protein
MSNSARRDVSDAMWKMYPKQTQERRPWETFAIEPFIINSFGLPSFASYFLKLSFPYTIVSGILGVWRYGKWARLSCILPFGKEVEPCPEALSFFCLSIIQEW